MQDQALGKVLKEISRLGGFHFSYVNKHIPVRQKVTISAENKTINEILEELFSGKNIEFIVVEGEVVLKPDVKEYVYFKDITDKYTISGHIRDKGSGESLIGATVMVADSGIGTVSNSYGFYSLTLPQGMYNLNFSFIGFGNFTTPIELNKDMTLDVTLDEDLATIQEVVITRRDRNTSGTNIVQISKINLKPETIKKMPALLGEVDVIKSLEAIPGITFFGDGSTLFYVRGGNKDQNLILIDDAPIFNPAHLFGFFSNIIPDATKDVQVYKGDMPAHLGGRLSSLIDIRTRDGSLKKFGMGGSLGFIASRLMVEGPISVDKSSFFVSGRISHFEWLVKQNAPSVESIYFADLNLKFNTILSSNNRLFFTFYYGKDNFFNRNANEDTSGIKWDNLSGSIRWNHLFSNRMFSNLTFFTGKYDYFLVTSSTNNDAWNSRIANTGIKADFTFYYNPFVTLRFGVKAGYHFLNPGNFRYGDDSRNSFVPQVPARNALEWNGYFSYKHQLGTRWFFRLGLRATIWQNTGKTTEYVFNENHKPIDTLYYPAGKVYHSYLKPEPRLGITYRISPNISLKTGYARNIQNIHLITNSVSPFTTLDVWLPSGPNIKPQISDQVSVGFTKLFPESGIDFSIEAYYKIMQNQIDYEYHATMLLNPTIEGELRFGEARSYGFEVQLKKDAGRFTGWIGYSLSKTTKKIKEIYLNEPYPAFYDRPHDFSTFISYHPGDRWTFSAIWIYTSGAAFTTPTSFYYYQGYSVPVYTEKNNDRLPPYHRLNLNINFLLSRPEKKFRHDLTFSLFNVYGRKNPISVNFNKSINQSGGLIVPANYYHPPILVPSQIWLYQIVPSLNYNFRF